MKEDTGSQKRKDYKKAVTWSQDAVTQMSPSFGTKPRAVLAPPEATVPSWYLTCADALPAGKETPKPHHLCESAL